MRRYQPARSFCYEVFTEPLSTNQNHCSPLHPPLNYCSSLLWFGPQWKPGTAFHHEGLHPVVGAGAPSTPELDKDPGAGEEAAKAYSGLQLSPIPIPAC
jgi:hypothetical protein